MSDTMQQPTGTGSLNDPEPAPVKNEYVEVWPRIIKRLEQTLTYTPLGRTKLVLQLMRQDMLERHEQGVAKYGVGLQPFNGRDALKDAYQEALDCMVYVMQAHIESPGEATSVAFKRAAELAEQLRGLLYARDGK